jgi:hypothetical protein
MTSSTILAFAFVVFALMLTGLALTAREFLKVSEDPSIRAREFLKVSEDPSIRKGVANDSSADEA